MLCLCGRQNLIILTNPPKSRERCMHIEQALHKDQGALCCDTKKQGMPSAKKE